MKRAALQAHRPQRCRDGAARLPGSAPPPDPSILIAHETWRWVLAFDMPHAADA
jgi:hypothetical protein